MPSSLASPGEIGGKRESNADVWDDGRPVNTKKHDLNKHSDSPPK